jgi:hypothetical protein
MALIRFELKEEHIKLLKHLNWEIDETNSIFSETENQTPYGGLSLIEDAGLILYGQPEGEFDPLSPYGPQYNDKQKATIVELYDELPKALDIILFNSSFEVGHYKTRWNQRNWKKYTPKI